GGHAARRPRGRPRPCAPGRPGSLLARGTRPPARRLPRRPRSRPQLRSWSERPDRNHESPLMANGGDVAALKEREADATAVEGDGRRAVDRKSHPTAVELAERKDRRSHADDDAAVDGDVPCRAGRSKHERDAE